MWPTLVTTWHTRNAPINRTLGVPGLGAPFFHLSCWNFAVKLPKPSRSPGFHLQVPKEGFVFPRFPRIPRFSRVFNSSCRSSARFFSRLLQINHFNQVSSYPCKHTLNAFLNAFYTLLGGVGNTTKHTTKIVWNIDLFIYFSYCCFNCLMKSLSCKTPHNTTLPSWDTICL